MQGVRVGTPRCSSSNWRMSAVRKTRRMLGLTWQATEPLLSTKSALQFEKRMCGSPAWIRTTIHGSKGRCPTVRRPGKIGWELRVLF